MLNISNNGMIIMNRGDTVKVPLFINAGDKTDMLRYILQDNDKIYFGVMEANAPFECSLIRKILTKDNLNIYGDVVLELGLNDTQYLQPGIYYYEAKLIKQPDEEGIITTDVEAYTVIPRTKFIINE